MVCSGLYSDINVFQPGYSELLLDKNTMDILDQGLFICKIY
jgi:hypothetical protein